MLLLTLLNTHFFEWVNTLGNHDQLSHLNSDRIYIFYLEIAFISVVSWLPFLIYLIKLFQSGSRLKVVLGFILLSGSLQFYLSIYSLFVAYAIG
jgi:hypothetical protein